ncbi:hypothetical protein IAQ61_008293 [Plenodomus lingam]|uniref:uncharacterized protein n=1 Tax=Leptosphaeria maculans TaxID=5022 RepID=UPI003325C6EE|nr:hypothetical protein IAQ61_008293 [Plenodomus lingam]
MPPAPRRSAAIHAMPTTNKGPSADNDRSGCWFQARRIPGYQPLEDDGCSPRQVTTSHQTARLEKTMYLSTSLGTTGSFGGIPKRQVATSRRQRPSNPRSTQDLASPPIDSFLWRRAPADNTPPTDVQSYRRCEAAAQTDDFLGPVTRGSTLCSPWCCVGALW